MRNDDAQRLGHLIRRRRLELDLTQEDLSERADLGQVHLSKIERGMIAHPSRETIIQLAAALDLSRNSLLMAAGHAPDIDDPVQEFWASYDGPISPEDRRTLEEIAARYRNRQ